MRGHRAIIVRLLDGARRRIHFFASRLKHSRWVEVSLVEDKRVERLVRAMDNYSASWSGLPLVAVFDRPKTMLLSTPIRPDLSEFEGSVR